MLMTTVLLYTYCLNSCAFPRNLSMNLFLAQNSGTLLMCVLNCFTALFDWSILFFRLVMTFSK